MAVKAGFKLFGQKTVAENIDTAGGGGKYGRARGVGAAGGLREARRF
jgi:hypothetical protein